MCVDDGKLSAYLEDGQVEKRLPGVTTSCRLPVSRV